MKRLSTKVVLALIGMLIVVLSLVVFLRRAPQPLKQRKHISGGATITAVSTATVIPVTASPWPVISPNAPAFASSEYYPAANANYAVSWRSPATPAWLAYELSGVPVSYRGEVLVVWYNPTYDYDHTLNGDKAYNLPQDYTIEVNMAPGNRNPPDSGTAGPMGRKPLLSSFAQRCRIIFRHKKQEALDILKAPLAQSIAICGYSFFRENLLC